jgi:hypothetical protein
VLPSSRSFNPPTALPLPTPSLPQPKPPLQQPNTTVPTTSLGPKTGGFKRHQKNRVWYKPKKDSPSTRNTLLLAENNALKAQLKLLKDATALAKPQSLPANLRSSITGSIDIGKLMEVATPLAPLSSSQGLEDVMPASEMPEQHSQCSPSAPESLTMVPWSSRVSTQPEPTALPRLSSDVQGKISNMSFPFSPLPDTDIQDMFISWGLDISSTPQKAENAIKTFKNLDFNQFVKFINDLTTVLQNINVDILGNSLVPYENSELEH